MLDNSPGRPLAGQPSRSPVRQRPTLRAPSLQLRQRALGSLRRARERLAERLADWRIRLLVSPRFVHRATRLPGGRWIARRRARRLFDLCAGFVYSQILLACVRLGLFEMLREAPASSETIAERVSLETDAAQRLLDAATALDLFERRSEGRFGLGTLGAALLSNPGLLAMIEHHALLYADLEDPVALLRGRETPTKLGRYWSYADQQAPSSLSSERVASYSALMSASQSLVAHPVLDAYPVARHRQLLDVGGGDGRFLAAAAARAPALRLVLFDLPAVAERAKDHFAACGLDARATAIGGDFLRDPLPRGADLVSLVRVLHDHEDDEVRTLLRAVRRAMDADATLLVAEPMSGTPGAESVGDAYFGFYLLAMGSGRTRTPSRLIELLNACGFEQCRVVPTTIPLQSQLIVARPGARSR